MPYRGQVFACGSYYHIYNRGARQAPIFFTDSHYDYCLKLLARYQAKYGACVLAYCLMPNHYHLLLRQETDQPLSKFIGVVFNAYVQAVNLQKARSGALFQGRFRHVWVDREEYLVQLCRYIHLNPVKAHLVSRPEQWPYSNYREWVRQRHEALWNEEFMREHFATAEAYAQFVEEHSIDQHVSEQIKPYMLDPEGSGAQ